MWAPQQAPHVGGPTVAPASRNILSSPESMARLYIDIAAGSTSVLILTFLPLSMRAAASRSSYLAPVHEPMYDLSSSTDGASLTGFTLAGENGSATTGSISDASSSCTSA